MLSSVSSKEHLNKQKCLHFERGRCSRGDSCRFLHAVETTEPPALQDESINDKPQSAPQAEQGRKYHLKLCRYYFQTGWCAFGSKCRFAHSRERQKPISRVVSEQAEDVSYNLAEVEEHVDDDQSVADSQQSGNGTKKLCKFFKRGYCRYGSRCRLQHCSSVRLGKRENNEDTLMKQKAYDKDCHGNKQRRQCDEDFTKSCSIEKRNKLVAQSSEPDIDLQELTDTLSLAEKSRAMQLHKQRMTEIRQLKRRYPTSVETELEDGCIEFKFIFEPTDPDWPYDVKQMKLVVTFTRCYPAEMMTVKLQDNERIPDTVEMLVTEDLQQWLIARHGSHQDHKTCELVFRPFMRWLDRNIEDLFTAALKEYKRELICATAGVQFIPASKLRLIYPQAVDSQKPIHEAGTVTSSASGNTVTGVQTLSDKGDLAASASVDKEMVGEVVVDAVELDETSYEGHPVVDVGTSQARKGTEVSLLKLCLSEGAATLIASQLAMILSCNRCSHHSDVKMTPGQTYTVECGRCHYSQLIKFCAEFAHAMSTVLGFVHCDGCQPFDLILNTCKFVVNCMACSNDATVDSLAVGQPNLTWCRQCHQKMSISTDGVRFTNLSAISLDGSKAIQLEASSKHTKIIRDPSIKEGFPLPGHGTCKHFKKSFRWLRFPCCGKAYACDRCHDEVEIGRHEMKLANRMICGFCSKEQPYAAERPCIACHSIMTNKSTDHWEGGKGCRNTIKMNRNDTKKYNSSSKTVSRAAEQKQNVARKVTKLRHV